MGGTAVTLTYKEFQHSYSGKRLRNGDAMAMSL